MTLIMKLFTKPDCGQCPMAKNVAQKVSADLWVELKEFNIDEVDGLAEAQFHQVLATPSIILVDDDEEFIELAGWRSEIPSHQELTIKVQELKKQLEEKQNAKKSEEEEVQSKS